MSPHAHTTWASEGASDTDARLHTAPKRAHAQLVLVDTAQALETSHTWLAP